MSVINSQPLIGASGNQGAAYNLTRSIRLRNSASAYLSRTPAGSGSLTTFTFSTWVKRGRLDIDGYLFSAVKSSPTATDAIRFNSNGSFGVFYEGSGTVHVRTSSVYRDPSAWYHVVVQIDSTQATASNRIKIYINGSQVTSLDITNYPSQNATFPAWNRAVLHTIGNDAQLALYADQYMAETHFIDGQYLDASSFGETDTATGVWKPKKYTGTYGTNGFYLKFDNLTSTSTLGNDSSGNSNTWTVNNISLTSGSTYDSMKDVPTLTDENTANYCILNPVNNPGGSTIVDGNLGVTTASSGFGRVVGTMAVSSGKWYWEVTPTNLTTDGAIGIAGVEEFTASYVGQTATSYGYFGSNGYKSNNATSTSYGATYVANDVIGVALDLDAGTLVFYKNNTSQGTAYSSLSGSFVPAISDGGTGTSVFNANFGQRPFAYTPPSGFKALNTFNLPTPTIGATATTQANKYFDATLYTANNSTQTIVNAGGFKPDFVWEKSRANAYSHQLFDSVRGVGKYLFSDQTAAEGTDATSLTAFNSNGYSVGATGNANLTNGTSSVGWQWRASNATGVSNTDGSITSTVSANTTAGFSIVTYTGDRTSSGSSTVGHGLGVAPSLIITKRRNGTSDWVVQTPFVGQDYFLLLNTTAAIQTSASTGAGTLPLPTSTTFGVTYYTGMNVNGQTCVAYCFAEVAGYSKFGSYTGNGSTDGPFIYTGFRPRFVMYKKSTGLGSWFMFDSARGTFNLNNYWLQANTNEAEQTDGAIDLLSNGFKQRASGGGSNTNGDTFIYMAFAENPFKYSLAR